MNFNYNHYVPCLRWKQGEYQAVLRLSDFARECIIPLIEVPEQGFDFETQTVKKTIDDHLAPFAKRVREKWGVRPCLVDSHHIDPAVRMADGRHPVKFVFDDLRSRGCLAVPVTGLHRDGGYHQSVLDIASMDKRGICLRLRIGEAAKPALKTVIDKQIRKSIRPEECDLILDLEAPSNFTPLEGFSKAIEMMVRRLPYLEKWRTFTLLGTSFPASMGEIRLSPATVPRNEWLLYQIVASNLAKAKLRVPSFGDYGINHPDLLQKDMRLLKPSATIRYTTSDSWFIIKGPNVRDNQFEQYRKHCRTVMQSTDFLGSGFSAGDKYIAECEKGSASTGNLTTWRWVGTNHHIEVVVREIANFDATSNNS